MLITKSLKTIGTGKDQVAVQYDRVYLTHGPNDELESYTKTTDGKVIQCENVVNLDRQPIGGSGDWTGSRPKSKISKHPVQELIEASHGYFAEKYKTEKVDGKDVQTDPWRVMLEAADYGADLWVKNTLQSQMAPAKVLSREDAIAGVIKSLVKAGKTQAQAIKMATLMYDSENESATA